MTVKYFCVRHNNRRKTQLTFETAIFKTKFTFWHIKLNV